MSRYITAAVLTSSSARCAIPAMDVSRGVRLDHGLTPERALVAVLCMVHSREGARVARGVDAIAARALATLPRLAPGQRRACEARVGAMWDAIDALPQSRRVAGIIALGYELHGRVTSVGAVWDDCALALDAVHAHVGLPVLDGLEAWAAGVADAALEVSS